MRGDKGRVLQVGVAHDAGAPAAVVDRLAMCHLKSNVEQKRAAIAEVAQHVDLTAADLVSLFGGKTTTWARHLRQATATGR